MGNAELVALLREARDQGESVDGLSDGLCLRIDAALAAHEAEERVEWMQNGFVAEEQIADVKGGTLVVQDRGPDDWAWMLIRRGRATTEDEAKAAALAAARGLR